MNEFEALVQQKKRDHGHDPDLMDMIENKEYGQYVKLVCRQCSAEEFVWRGPENATRPAKIRRNPHHRY